MRTCAVGSDTQWVSVAVYGDLAQDVAGHLRHGDRCYAAGKLKLATWTAKTASSGAA